MPSAVSAIKVKGVRSYTRVRQGDTVDLPGPAGDGEPVRRALGASGHRDASRSVPPIDVVDVDVEVDVSSGTYVRALARDLGAALGVGGHLTALRRTRVGRFGIGDAALARRPHGHVRGATGRTAYP